MVANSLGLALLSAAVLGFRHGFDYDHIAAITDITSVDTDRRRSMRLALLYVLGHATMVAALGGTVILFRRSLPKSIDNWAERAVGLTLLILGLYVLGTLLRDKANLPKSRASLMIAGCRWLGWKLRRLFGAAPTAAPEQVTATYSRWSVFLIGMIHGLGAETPSQLLLFLLAVNLGGVASGLLGLAVFLTGLLLMNTLMTASAVGIIGISAAKPQVLRFIIGTTAIYSTIVGSIFLFGVSSVLPQLG